MFASRFKSIRKWFENCIVRPANQMNAPALPGIFVGADGTSLLGPDEETKMRVSDSERASIGGIANNLVD
jgi:hypothetical protein